MFKCCVIVVIALAAVAVLAGDVACSDPYDGQKIVHELPCVMQGGLCVRRADCPRDQTARGAAGLCPLSEERGFLCCHSLPLSERHCRALGGECMPRCGVAALLSRATDCGQEQCCRLE